MMIYTVLDESNKVLGGYFQEKSAKIMRDDFAPSARIIPIEVADLEASVTGHIIARGGIVPNPTNALMFLVSELGELADALTDEKADWARNNDKTRSIPDEAADVLYMLLAFSWSSGFNLLEAMFAKMERTAKTWPGL